MLLNNRKERTFNQLCALHEIYRQEIAAIMIFSLMGVLNISKNDVFAVCDSLSLLASFQQDTFRATMEI
jgi:hypothetical protein